MSHHHHTMHSHDSDERKRIPIQICDYEAHSDQSTLRHIFTEQMRKVEEEMSKFSEDLLRFTKVYRADASTHFPNNAATFLDNIINSPLVEDEGDAKILTLKFDVSQYQPQEVQVSFKNDVVTVTAKHSDQSDNSAPRKEFVREFVLPPDTDPGSLDSFITQDGLLTIKVPLALSYQMPYVQ